MKLMLWVLFAIPGHLYCFLKPLLNFHCSPSPPYQTENCSVPRSISAWMQTLSHLTHGALFKGCFSPHPLQTSEKVIAANAKLTPCYDRLSAVPYVSPLFRFCGMLKNAAECKNREGGAGREIALRPLGCSRCL